MIQADTLVKGSLLKAGGSLLANVHVFDIATTQLRHSFQESANIQNVDVLASVVARRMAEKLSSGTEAALPASVDNDPIQNTHFIKGLGFHHSGLYDHAVAEFMHVLDLDPERADARLWLARSYAAAGEAEHATLEFRRFLREFPDHADARRVRAALESQLEAEHAVTQE